MNKWRQIVRAIAIAANAYVFVAWVLISVQQLPTDSDPVGDDWSFLIAFLLVPLVSLGALIWQPRHRN